MASNFEKMKELIAQEKRLCDRLELPIKIRYIALNKGARGSRWSDYVFLDNIGGQGLGFTDNTVLAMGDKLEIELSLPQEQTPVFFGAEVMWIHKNFRARGLTAFGKFSYGLRIYHLDDEARRKFEQFISDSIIEKYVADDGKLKDIPS